MRDRASLEASILFLLNGPEGTVHADDELPMDTYHIADSIGIGDTPRGIGTTWEILHTMAKQGKIKMIGNGNTTSFTKWSHA